MTSVMMMSFSLFHLIVTVEFLMDNMVSVGVFLAMNVGTLEMLSGTFTFLVFRCGLHLKDKISCLYRYVIGMEHTRISIEATTSLVPSICIKSFKIITPV